MKETFAERLALALQIRGMRAVDLSIATNISKSRISQYLKGTYEAKEETLKLLARALNVHEVWLMGYDVPIERSSGILEMDITDDLTLRKNYNDSIKNPHPDEAKTIAAHHDGEDWTEEELKDIEKFKAFLISQRKEKNEEK